MKIIAFGEVLFDIFDGREKIGGAPFNFAAHCIRFGAQVDFVSAVGDDRLGREALAALGRYGVSSRMTAVTNRPTGYCRVTLNDGKPSYELVAGVAYDAIPLPDAELYKNESYDALYFGTLACRDKKSAETLKALARTVSCRECFFDVNLRQSYYSREVIEYGLNACSVLKLSREEAQDMCHSVGMEFSSEALTLCRALAGKYGIKKIIYTLDSDGAAVYDAATDSIISEPARKVKVVSTVGAGDSFGAAWLCARLSGAADREALIKAVEYSSEIVQIEEAIPPRAQGE